jgi:outer membrane lipoprotein carrier protein
MRILLTILLCAGSLYPQHPSAADVLGKIRARYQQLNDASAGFTQTVKRKYQQGGKQISGTVKIKKGNKYRIDSDLQTIVTDGATVWMFTPGTKQVLIDRFKANRQPFSPEQFLLGLPSDFTAVSVSQSDSLSLLRLQPTAKNSALSGIASLSVWTSDADWIVRKIEITEKNGTTKTIVLSDIRFNMGIDDAAFRFVITDEMHIVDMKKLQ